MYVVSETGDLVEGLRYALGLASQLSKADESDVGSRQLDAARVRARCVEPRIPVEGLIQILDWNTWHARAVEVKALLVAGLGWWVERDGATVYESMSQEGDPADPAVRLLLRPSADEPLMTIDGLLQRTLIDYYATGNAYLEVVYNRRGEVAELYHIPARTMRRGRERTRYWQLRDGRRKAFPAFGHGGTGARSEVLHVYRYDPASDYYGIPGWQGALLDRTPGAGAHVQFAQMDVTNVSHDACLLTALLQHGVYTGGEIRPVADRLLGL